MWRSLALQDRARSLRSGLGILALLLGLAPTASAVTGPVLGPDAAAPVQAWTAKLKGLRPTATAIQRDHIQVRLGSDCLLVLHHAGPSPQGEAAPKSALGPCPDAVVVGDAVACWAGDGCPAQSRRSRALNAAGPLALPWRGADGAASPDRARLLDLREVVQQHLLRQDRDAARKVLAGLDARSDVRPIDWLSLAPILAWAGEPRVAWEVASGERLASLGLARVAALRALLLLGPHASGAVAAALMRPDDACTMAAFSATFLSLRAYEAAGDLGAAIRGVAPDCFEAYATEAEAWTILRRLDRQKVVSEAALARFAGQPRLIPIEEAYFVDHGKAHVVRERLEKAVTDGEAEAGALKRLLGFYIQVEGRVERLGRFRVKADADPTDVLANFFTGVLLHYERDYEASSRYLSRVVGKVSDEPRLFIYLAMNAFNLGDRAGAEATIARAEALDLEDPDVAYCVGEIFRDTDRPRAVRAIDRYWEMTRFTSDVKSIKQQRVWQMRLALQRCVDADTPAPCPGPWEHTFDSVAIKRANGSP